MDVGYGGLGADKEHLSSAKPLTLNSWTAKVSAAKVNDVGANPRDDFKII